MKIEKILQDLIKFQTNHEQYDNGIRKYIISLLKNHKVEIISIPKTNNNSFAIKIKGKSVNKKPVGFLCHLDTINASEDWNINPYNAIVRGRSIYGLGASDMKGPIASVMRAVCESMPLERDVYLMFTSDEETSAQDVKKLYEKVKLKKSFIIAPEPTDGKIIIGQKGILEVKIEIPGKSLHASCATLKINEKFNAIYKMSKIVDFIKFQEARFQKKKFKPVKNISVVNFGRIEGGSAVNKLAEKCCLEVSYRLNDEDRIDLILKEIKNEIKKIDKNAKLEVLLIGDSFINKNMKELKKIKNIASHFLPRIKFEYGKIWSEVVEFNKNENICVIFGPGSCVQAHKANEKIEIDRLYKLCQVYKRILKEV